MSDFTVDDHGPIVLLKPETAEAVSWIAEHLGAQAPWFAGAIALERQYVDRLLHGIDQAELTWEPDDPTVH
jgi:hypothetical protein